MEIGYNVLVFLSKFSLGVQPKSVDLGYAHALAFLEYESQKAESDENLQIQIVF